MNDQWSPFAQLPGTHSVSPEVRLPEGPHGDGDQAMRKDAKRLADSKFYIALHPYKSYTISIRVSDN